MSLERSIRRSRFSRLRRVATYFLAALGDIGRPLLHLWPWIIGIGVFAALLDSPQGAALAGRYRETTYDTWGIAGLIAASSVSVAISALLALLGPSMRDLPDRGEDPIGYNATRVRVLAGGLWIVLASSAYGALFVAYVHMVSVAIGVAGLAIAGAVGTAWMARSVRYPGGLACRIAATIQRHEFIVVVLVSLLTIAPLALGAYVSVSNPLRLTDIGPLAVGLVGTAALSTLLGIVVVVIPLYLGQPLLGVVFIVAMAVWTSNQRPTVDLDNPLLRDFDKASLHDLSQFRPKGPCVTLPSSLEGAVRQHAELQGGSMSAWEYGRNVYFVSAEGGGIRAAYWTAITLADLDIATRGSFGEEVASLSGVSGGSLGIATWLAARERDDLSPTARMELITRFLDTDFLSPALGGFLFLDVPRLLVGPLWPSARRDQVFEKALADRWKGVAKSGFFGRQMLHACVYGFRAAPAVFFNATDALSGEYVPLSNSTLALESRRRVAPRHWNEGLDPAGPPPVSWRLPFGLSNTSLAKATFAQMVSISARFPYLSPEAHVGIDATALAMAHEQADRNRRGTESAQERVELYMQDIGKRLDNLSREKLWSRVWVLVDGGYFDNTGLTPTREAIDYVERQRQKERATGEALFGQTRVHVVHIANDPGDPCLTLPDRWQDRLDRRSKEFLDVAKDRVSCASDVEALNQAVRTQPLYPFLAPFDALLNVRVEHSRQTVAQLREELSARDGYELEIRDLGAAFADAYGTGIKARGHSDSEMVQRATRLAQEAAQYAAKERIETAERVQHGLSPAAADVYLNAVSEWQDMVNGNLQQISCHNNFPPVGPPLGWTLSRHNEAIMRCLSIRDRNVAGFLGRKLEPPYLALAGREYTTDETRFRQITGAQSSR